MKRKTFLLILITIIIPFISCKKLNEYQKLSRVLKQSIVIQTKFIEKINTIVSTDDYAVRLQTYIKNMKLMQKEYNSLVHEYPNLTIKKKYPTKIKQQIKEQEKKLKILSIQVLQILNSKKFLKYNENPRVKKILENLKYN